MGAILIATALLCACRGDQKVAAHHSKPPSPKNVIYFYRGIPFLLDKPIGVMLVDEPINGKSTPLYIVSTKSPEFRIETRELPRFIAELKKLPSNSIVVEYDSCSVPRWYGLDFSIRENFEMAISSAGHRLAPESSLTCVCDASG